MSFPQVRAYPADLKPEDRTLGKLVTGWYLKVGDVHLLTTRTIGGVYHSGFPDRICLVGFIEIDFTSAGVATGKKDKHGVEIFGSMGDMQGGDRVKQAGHNQNSDKLEEGFVERAENGRWFVRIQWLSDMQCHADIANDAEIIPQESK